MKTIKENAVIKCDNFEQLKECREKLIRFGFRDDEKWNKQRLINSIHKEFPEMNFVLLSEDSDFVQIHTHECIERNRVYLHYYDLDSYLEKTYGIDFDNPTEEQKEMIRYWIDKFIGHSMTEPYDEFVKKHLSPKPKIEVGKFYKSNVIDNKFMLYITDFELSPDGKFKIVKGYGFASDGEWIDCPRLDATYYYNLSESTEQEIAERLIEEAKRRGYKEGNFKCLLLPTKHIGSDFMIKDGSIFMGCQCCMHKGKWADIIDEKAEVKQKIQNLKKEIDDLEKLI
jgi:hypothetical protein